MERRSGERECHITGSYGLRRSARRSGSGSKYRLRDKKTRYILEADTERSGKTSAGCGTLDYRA